MRREFLTGVFLSIFTASSALSPVSAQTIGTFGWQLAPFCNVVTVTVTQSGGVYTLDGYDSQCGAPQRAPLVGMATANPDGTIGLGLQIVTVPGGRLVSVDARISLAGLGGPWTDSAGNSGAMLFNGPGTGAARPLPTSAPAWGAVVQGPAASSAPGLLVRNPDPAGTAAPAIIGQVGPAPTIGSSGAAGLVGQSRDQVGVAGISDVAIGVLGGSGTGYGVIGTSVSGIGVVAATSAGGTALLLANGAIGVAGTTRSVFQHTATSGAGGNINGNLTRIDHPLLNGDPNALVFVEHVYAPGALVYIENGVGVYYDTAVDKWSIFREDQATMPAGARFNVLVIKQ